LADIRNVCTAKHIFTIRLYNRYFKQNFKTMEMKTTQGFLLIFFLFICVSILKAQTDSLSTLSRDELTFSFIKKAETNDLKIVTASRSAKSIDELPVTLYIISRNEILANGYVTLADVLKSVPGMRVSQPGSSEDGETFLMRGLRGNYYTKILINNAPVAPSVSGTTVISAQLPIRQAERIEIIFGPAAAVYGADATAGVINIITKTADSHVFSQADIMLGQNGYQYENFTVGGKAGKNRNILQYSIYGSRMSFSDMNIITTKDNVYHPLNYIVMQTTLAEATKALQLESVYEFDFEKLETVGLATHDFFPVNYKGTLSNPIINRIPQSSQAVGIDLRFKGLRIGYNKTYMRIHSSIGLNTFLYRFDNPENFIGYTQDLVSVSYDKGGDKFASTSNFSYLRHRMDNYSSRGLTYLHDIDNVFVYNASDDVLMEQLFTYIPNKKLEFVSGVTFRYSGNLPTTNELWHPFETDYYSAFSTKKIPDDDIFGDFGFNPITFYNAGFFGQAYIGLKRMKIIAGIRHDRNSMYGTATNPRFALLYKFGKRFSVRTSTGYAYKAPAPNIAYYSIAIPAMKGNDPNKLDYAVIPNPNLKPEKFIAGETAFRYVFNQNTVFDISFFSYEIENLIYGVPIEIDTLEYPRASVSGDQTFTRQYINQKDARTLLNGIQASLLTKNLFPRLHIGAEITLSLTNGQENLAGDSVVKIDDMRLQPGFFLQARLWSEPIENLYISAQNIVTSMWYRSYMPSEEYYYMPYSQIDGYYSLDVSASYQISKQLNFFFKVINVFDTQYGGIDATGLDIDMQYNPQLRRNFRMGISFSFE